MAPIPENSLVPRCCTKCLPGTNSGKSAPGTHKKGKLRPRLGNITCLASPNEWQVGRSNDPSVCLSQTQGKSEAPAGGPGSGHQALPL